MTWRSWSACFIMAALLGCASSLSAQESPTAIEPWQAGLGQGPGARLAFHFEVTFMKIDVAHVTALLDATTAAEVHAIVSSGARDKSRSLAVAGALTAADSLAFGFVFDRGGSFDRFLKATRKNLDKAARTGFVAPAEADTVWADFQGFMAPLDERGAVVGDRLLYRIEPMGVSLWYCDPSGDILARQRFARSFWGPAVKGQMLAEGVKLREHFLKAAWSE